MSSRFTQRTSISLKSVSTICVAILLGTGGGLHSAFAGCRDVGGGLTALQPSHRSRVVYVSSSSGDDSRNGLSPQNAKRTIAAGYALLRDGQPDFLLLKRGDTFNESLEWRKSGLDAQNRMVMSVYGAGHGRAYIKPALNQNGIYTFRDSIRHVAITNLDLEPVSYDPFNQTSGTGLSFVLRPFHDLLLENNRISHFSDGIVIQGASSTAQATQIRLRYNVIFDNHVSNPTNGHSQGGFFSQTNGLLLEENFFDQNGFSPLVAGTRTIFNHNVYIQYDTQGVVARGNVIARTAANGIQLRAGGVAEGNLFINNPIALNAGSGGAAPEVAANFRAVIRGNVVDGSDNIGSGFAGGWGIDVFGGRDHEIEHNLLINRGAVNQMGAIKLNSTATYPMAGVIVRNNATYNWGGDLQLSLASSTGAVVVDNNKFHSLNTGLGVVNLFGSAFPLIQSTNNRMSCANLAAGQSCVNAGQVGVSTLAQFFGMIGDQGSREEAPNFTDATRSVATYYNRLRGGNSGKLGFLAEARQQGVAAPRNCALSASDVIPWVKDGFTPAAPNGSIIVIRK